MINEIRAGDLHFSEDETAIFMTATMKLNLEKEAVTLLNLMTEGWIVGLQLAALSIQGCTSEEIDSFLVEFSGSNRHIVDYLISEVLANLPSDIGNFLHQTSVLERFCASLCDAVTVRENSRQVLELLERNNLFLFPLDEERQWYRYHHLFADSLRMELSQEEERFIHRKAARWYETNGYLEEAVDQAITAVDYQEAGRLIELVGDGIFKNGNLKTITNWMDALPDDFIRSRGGLSLYKIFILFFQGKIEAIEPYVMAFENDLQAKASKLNQSRMLYMLSDLANSREDPQCLQLAKEALELAKGSYIDYNAALNTYGLALLNFGNLSEAIKFFNKAFELRHEYGYTFLTIYTLYYLLLSLELNGRRSEVVGLGEDILMEMKNHRGLLFNLSRLIYLPLGIAYYKANDLSQAYKYLREGVDICRKLSFNQTFNGEYLLARVYHALGDSEKALTTIRGAIRETNSSIQRLVAFDNTALEAELLLRQGNLKAAVNWAEHWRLTPDDKPTPAREQSYFTFIRLLLTLNRFQEALTLLDYLESSIRSGQRYSHLITVHILQALAHHLSGEECKSRQYLSQALILAAPEGYYRLFLDEGPLIVEILPGVCTVEPRFTAELLAFFTKAASALPELSADQGESLSNREKELLVLITAGFSNEEIAGKLTISLNTTKWHIHNILQKLGVKSRTQAIRKAKELNIV